MADPTKGKAPEAGGPTGGGKPDLVIWHGNDERLQSQQQKEASAESSFHYLCAYRIKEKKFLRLADDKVRSVSILPKQRWAIGHDDRAMRRSRTLDGRTAGDVYVIDLHTGERSLALKQKRFTFTPSPDGSRYLYYDAGHFFCCDMATKKCCCVSKDAKTSFINMEHDYNIDKMPTRPMGWSKDGSAVLVSDNWDVWKLPVNGEGPAVNLTGNGKKDGIRYRARLALDPEEKGVDLAAPLYFSVFGEWTKKSGFARVDPKHPGANRPVLGRRRVLRPDKGEECRRVRLYAPDDRGVSRLPPR